MTTARDIIDIAAQAMYTQGSMAGPGGSRAIAWDPMMTTIIGRLLRLHIAIPVAITLVVAVVTAVVMTRPRTVVWGTECDEIGATARFEDGSPAVCEDVDLSPIGGHVGSIWLWPKDYHPGSLD